MPKGVYPRNTKTICHPERRHWAKGLCKSCSRKEYGWKKSGIKNFTIADYNRRYALQGGTCAICRKPPKGRQLAADHNHKTGVFRGLLCWKCNRHLIGNHTDPAIFIAAANYLKGGV